MGFGSTLALAGAQLGVGFLQRRQEQRAIAQAADEQNRLASLRVEELERQIGEEEDIAREKKSERVREADRSFASMVVALAEQGGLRGANAARGAAEIGFQEGLDLARIKANSASRKASLRAGQKSARDAASSFNKQAEFDSQASGMRFLSSGLSIAGSVVKDRKDQEAAKQRGGT
ncbi:MAG: hypothetical protein GY906_23265 [bacterium]|nr:hypothetical protein [bacterium]